MLKKWNDNFLLFFVCTFFLIYYCSYILNDFVYFFSNSKYGQRLYEWNIQLGLILLKVNFQQHPDLSYTFLASFNYLFLIFFVGTLFI
jgi:hypothetical protein